MECGEFLQSDLCELRVGTCGSGERLSLLRNFLLLLFVVCWYERMESIVCGRWEWVSLDFFFLFFIYYIYFLKQRIQCTQYIFILYLLFI